MEVCFFMCSHVLLGFCSNHFMPTSAPAEVSSVTVCSCWDVIPVFADMLTGIKGRLGKKRVGEGQAKSKSYRSQCHVVFFILFCPNETRILSSVVSLFVIFDV